MTLRELQSRFLPSLAPEDFFLLIAHATGEEKVFLLAHPEYELSPEVATKVEAYLRRRLEHEPVAYITGHREFYGREFHVTRDTLIPRPETEHLIETALNAIFNFQFSIFKNIDIIDVGTGSGNIIITLAKEIEKRSHQAEIKYFALDISKSALAIAKDNAMRHDIATKITFLESDLLKHLPVSLLQDHHLIITANLPYLSHNIYHESDPDVRDYEPASALVSGEDGLDHYVRLLTEIHTFLPHVRSLTFFFEISPEQTTLLTTHIRTVFPQVTPLVFQDLSGRDRLIQATI
jgi:release factor glutamine methyltransferase